MQQRFSSSGVATMMQRSRPSTAPRGLPAHRGLLRPLRVVKKPEQGTEQLTSPPPPPPPAQTTTSPFVQQLTQDVPAGHHAGLSASFVESCESLDNATFSGRPPPAFLEAGICRLFYFDKHELESFSELVGSMKNARGALLSLAGANVLLSLTQALGLGGHHAEGAEAGHSALFLADTTLTIGDVAYWADSLMIAAIISYAIGPFERVLRSKSNQMAYCFQGVNRLSLIFQQLTIGSFAVTTVTGLEAAAKYPELVPGTSAVFFVLATIRAVAMWWALDRHAKNNEEVSRTLAAIRGPQCVNGSGGGYVAEMPLLDRIAVFLAFGYLLQFEDEGKQQRPALAGAAAAGGSSGDASAAATPGGGGSGPESDPRFYEFSLTEERLLRGLTESASVTGLALGLQAFVTLMLTVADVGVSDFPGMVSHGINFTNKFIMAAVLFNACTAYDRALHTAGSNDVEHLMEGLGHKGLTGLFESLAVLSWAITIATLAGLAVPFIEEDVLGRFVGDGLSHRTAEAVIEALEWGRAILRGI